MSELVLFADFVDAQPGSVARTYKPVTDRTRLQSVLEEIYMRQNVGNAVVQCFDSQAGSLGTMLMFFPESNAVLVLLLFFPGTTAGVLQRGYRAYPQSGQGFPTAWWPHAAGKFRFLKLYMIWRLFLLLPLYLCMVLCLKLGRP